jgi:hypothetical protein
MRPTSSRIINPERRTGASARTRRARAARNDLWTAWLRRPLARRLRRSPAILVAAGAVAPQATLAAMRGARWVARERGTLPRAAEDEARLVDRLG